ncbi:MAG: alpha/beta fold hydrolase, partial [Phycisphaeraceae bacterium]
MSKMRFEYITSGENELAASVSLPPPEAATEAAPDAGGGPWPTVIVVHGLTGSRMGKSYHLVEFARKLAERGIACVRFDQAGCGESTGKFEDLTIRTMADDARAVYEWTRAQPWCDRRPRPRRIGVTALSLGALAAAGLPDGMGLALWAGVFDLPGVFKVTAKTGLRALLEHQGWIPYR